MNALASSPISSCKETPTKMALIAEGGGQRGIFTAGVLDAWLENDFNAQAAWTRQLKSRIYVSKYCPKIIDYWVQHEQVYQKEIAFITNPPEDVEIIQVFAENNIRSKLLGRTGIDLQHDYHAGIAAGNTFLETRQAFYSTHHVSYTLPKKCEQIQLSKDNKYE